MHRVSPAKKKILHKQWAQKKIPNSLCLCLCRSEDQALDYRIYSIKRRFRINATPWDQKLNKRCPRVADAVLIFKHDHFNWRI